MNAPFAPLDQRVTASELVRQFGLWQERAARAPVYVLHRGRPRFVLTSVEIMDALCSPHLAPQGEAAAEGLIALLRDAAILFGPTGAVRHHNRAAATMLGAPDDLDPALAGIAARVIAAGLAEQVELAPQRRPDRRIACLVEPLGEGAALIARDVTLDERLRALEAGASAIDAAFVAAGTGATALINPRGYIVRPGPALVAMTAVPAETLARTRLVTLLHVADRVAAGEAIDTAFAGRAAGGDARLLVNRGATLAVRIGITPIRVAGRIDTALVALLPRSAG